MPRRPVRIAVAAVVAVLGLSACGDDVTRIDEEEEPTILQPNVDEIVTEAP